MSGTIWNHDEFRRHGRAWMGRQRELARRRAYYDGTIYRSVRERLGAFGPVGPRLYRGVKSLYLPCARAVDVDAGIVPGGWKLAPGGERFERAMRKVWGWSGWQREGVLFVHYGAMYGVTGLKVSDLREIERVVVKPLDPCKFLLVAGDEYDGEPDTAIIVERRWNDQGEQFEYAEVITRESVRTFADGEPRGFGGRPAEYVNELGVVPVVEVCHVETGEELGESTFQKAIPLLDEVNELASYLADIIKKHAEPQWAVIGAEPGDLEKSGANVWFVPAGGDAKALVAGIDVGGVLAFVQEIRDQVIGALPELAFDELKRKDQVATATVELQLMELVLKVRRVRPNYDAGLAWALRLAGYAAESMGLGELAGLDDEALKFDDERPVLPLDPVTAATVAKMELELEGMRSKT